MEKTDDDDEDIDDDNFSDDDVKSTGIMMKFIKACCILSCYFKKLSIFMPLIWEQDELPIF